MNDECGPHIVIAVSNWQTCMQTAIIKRILWNYTCRWTTQLSIQWYILFCCIYVIGENIARSGVRNLSILRIRSLRKYNWTRYYEIKHADIPHNYLSNDIHLYIYIILFWTHCILVVEKYPVNMAQWPWKHLITDNIIKYRKYADMRAFWYFYHNQWLTIKPSGCFVSRPQPNWI